MQFLAGVIFALLTVVPGVVFFLHKMASKNRSRAESAFRKSSEQALSLIGELAHEIKNPLSTIKINLKLTAEQLSDLHRSCGDVSQAGSEHGFARASRKIAVIDKEAGRLEQILNSFLRFADKTEPQLKQVDINELISDMIDFYSAQGHSHSITVRHSLAAEPLVCKVDPDMLKQAILNLFINAQQAMIGGGELMIRTEKAGKDAVIFISDTGCGIEADKLGHIFDAYYSSRPDGNGLGLPTAKKIIEAHNGSVTVDSEPGKGTLFTIKLPWTAIL